MPSFRIPVSMALITIAMTAFALASIRSASALWCIRIFSVELLALATVILGAILKKGPARPPWLGATVFGLISLAVTSPNLILPVTPGYFVESIGEVFDTLHPRPPSPSLEPTLEPAELDRLQANADLREVLRTSESWRFKGVVTSVIVIAFTLMGAVAGHLLKSSSRFSATLPLRD